MITACFCHVFLLELWKAFKTLSCLFSQKLDRKYYKAPKQRCWTTISEWVIQVSTAERSHSISFAQSEGTLEGDEWIRECGQKIQTVKKGGMNRIMYLSGKEWGQGSRKRGKKQRKRVRSHSLKWGLTNMHDVQNVPNRNHRVQYTVAMPLSQ